MFFHMLAFALLGQLTAPSDGFEAKARAACAAPVGARPRIPGIAIEAIAARSGDLSYLRVTDRESGGSMNAYYDPSAERAAWARAACLGAQIRLLHSETGGAWRDGRWFSVVFTPRSDYIPPRSVSEKRWRIATAPDGTLTPAGHHMVVVVMPHEQVHAFQQRMGAEARKGARALQEATEPVALARWGGMQVKPEAILCQVSPEEREKIKADPHYTPAGPFNFGPGDMISDESNTPARYEAAWRVFASLETTHGAVRVEAWVEELTAAGGSVTPARILETAQAELQEDLSSRLQ